MSNICCGPGAGTVSRCYIWDVMIGPPKGRLSTAVFPQYLFHFLLPPAKAMRQYSSEEKRAPLEINCLSVFENYTKISVVKYYGTTIIIKR